MLDLWWWHPAKGVDGWCRARLHWLPEPPETNEALVSQLWRREILSAYCALAPDKLCFSKGDKGKPVLDKSQVHFSLSHGYGWHVILVSDAPCGVDVEPWSRKVSSLRRPQVLKRFAEQEELREASDDDLLRCWTMKEAWAKHRGCSLWQLLSTPLTKTATGWQIPANIASGHLDPGACVSWAATAGMVPEIYAYDSGKSLSAST